MVGRLLLFDHPFTCYVCFRESNPARGVFTLSHSNTTSFLSKEFWLGLMLGKKPDMFFFGFLKHDLLSPRRAMVLVVRPARPRSIEQPLISARSAIQDINSAQMAVATLFSVLSLVRVNLVRPAVLKKIEGQITNVRSAIQDSD